MKQQNTTSLTKKAFIEAYKKTFGNVTQAANAIGIDRTTHYRWLEEDEEYKANIENVEPSEIFLDFVESKLSDKISKGDTTAIIFALKTKGKKRGYIERTEVHQETTIKSLDINIIDEGIALSKSEKDIAD
jgi:hypothetical protein